MGELPDYGRALEYVLTQVSGLDASVVVELEAAIGCVLSEAIVADRAIPPFNRSMLDGYAIRARDVRSGGRYEVFADVPAGVSSDVRVPPGSCVKIATGASIPRELDAVIPHEQSDRGDPVSLTVDRVEAGSGIHPRGADASKGDVVLEEGTTLAAHHIGIAASVGRSAVRVRAKPTAVVLTSGDEVRHVDETPESYQIRNSNGPMLASLLRRFGASDVGYRHLPDDRTQTIDAVREAIAGNNIVVTVGGVSAGERDYFPEAYRNAQLEMMLRGALIQPGKPIHVGRVPGGAIVVGVPGNPVSALVTAHLFVWPILRVLQGGSSSLSWTQVTLRESVKPNSRRFAFRPATLHGDGTVSVPRWSGSGDLIHTAATQGMVALPRQENEVEEGTLVPFLAWA